MRNWYFFVVANPWASIAINRHVEAQEAFSSVVFVIVGGRKSTRVSALVNASAMQRRPYPLVFDVSEGVKCRDSYASWFLMLPRIGEARLVQLPVFVSE